jgi:hypothetical protein
MKKLILLILIIVGSVTSNAQDTTRTPIGYDIDYPHVYVRVDTVHGLSYIYNYYPHKMYFSVNGKWFSDGRYFYKTQIRDMLHKALPW